MKHTKGPWQQVDSHPPYEESYAATVWGPEGPGHGLIADCRQSWIPKEERIYNAKLIATAPKLRKALVAAVKYHNDYEEGLRVDDSWVIEAKKAIAESEGWKISEG